VLVVLLVQKDPPLSPMAARSMWLLCVTKTLLHVVYYPIPWSDGISPCVGVAS
jgi:hypothetical protein